MANTNFTQNSEDAQAAADQVAADEAQKAVADKAAADEAARVEAEKAAADQVAADEAANQAEADVTVDPRDELVQVVLDPDFAEAYDVDSATVGTANGEYVLTSEPVDVERRDLDNVLASPAAKESE